VSTDESLQRVSAMIREVIGEDWDLDEEITMETSFSDDLELESIEFVSLAEKIQAEYGDSVDFVTWLSSKELDEIIAL
jgi:acyl carrier protein